ncbi:MAG: DoxX family protein [Saprospiraceae bacterium]|nr:DoxX family protein [Saprospiraceae bacterium]
MDQIFSNLPTLFITAFFAILFLQSGLDKLLDYRGNLDYLSEHFKNSPLSGSVRLLLPTITVLEVLTGLVSAWAFLQVLLTGQSTAAIFSPALAGVSLLSLFFGQRVGKDYAGAASLVPYFAVVLLGLWMIKM